MKPMKTFVGLLFAMVSWRPASSAYERCLSLPGLSVSCAPQSLRLVAVVVEILGTVSDP